MECLLITSFSFPANRLKNLWICKDIGDQMAGTYDINNYFGFSQIETADLVNNFDLSQSYSYLYILSSNKTEVNYYIESIN